MRRSVPAVPLILAGLTSAHAHKPAPLPTLENLAGAWVATGSWGMQYRLVMDPSGEGRLGGIDLPGEPWLADMTGIMLDRDRIEIDVASRGRNADRRVLKGDATTRSIVLKCRPLFGKSRVIFYGETEWERSAARLAAATSETDEQAVARYPASFPSARGSRPVVEDKEPGIFDVIELDSCWRLRAAIRGDDRRLPQRRGRSSIDTWTRTIAWTLTGCSRAFIPAWSSRPSLVAL